MLSIIRRSQSVLPVLIVFTFLVGSACAYFSPEAKKERHLERGDAYFEEGKYREAVLEYRNVLQIENENAHAIEKAGLALFELGEFGQAFPFLNKASELVPDNLEVRLKLGAVYFLGQRHDDARAQAEFVLEKDPRNLDAFALLVDSTLTSEGAAAVLERLEQVRADHGSQAKFHLAVGNLQLKQRDIEAAEAALQQAVSVEPDSVPAHTALGNFYVAKRDLDKAEQEYRAAADNSPVDSPVRLQLATFFVRTGKTEEAKKVLTDVTTQEPEAFPAWVQLGALHLIEGKLDESDQAVDVVLEKNELHPGALLLKGRIQVARQETTTAIQTFQTLLNSQPEMVAARYQLALAHIQAGNVEQAKSELRQAVNTAPNYVDALVLLSQLNVRTNAEDTAIADLEGFVSRQPNVPQVYSLLGAAYMRRGEHAKSVESFTKFKELAPQDARGPYLLGEAFLAQNNIASAKEEFENALTLAPGFAQPLSQLVAIAYHEKRPDEALARAQKQIALMPNVGGLHTVLGDIYRTRGDVDSAEQSYLRALELEPKIMGVYTQLGTIYGTSGRVDEALAKLEEGLEVDADNQSILMLTGMLYQQKGDNQKAEEAYEKIIANNPGFAPASNNLAYLISERGGDQDRALELAQNAKEADPDNPMITDTLGWILYKRGLYQRALGLFQEAVEKVPNNAEIQYHLGMTYYHLEDRERAKEVLTRALELSADFPGAEEARRTLESL